jgi:hypothetical protein
VSPPLCICDVIYRKVSGATVFKKIKAQFRLQGLLSIPTKASSVPAGHLCGLMAETWWIFQTAGPANKTQKENVLSCDSPQSSGALK